MFKWAWELSAQKQTQLLRAEHARLSINLIGYQTQVVSMNIATYVNTALAHWRRIYSIVMPQMIRKIKYSTIAQNNTKKKLVMSYASTISQLNTEDPERGRNQIWCNRQLHLRKHLGRQRRYIRYGAVAFFHVLLQLGDLVIFSQGMA